MIRATDWRPLERGTLRGFLTLHLDSGIVLRDCGLHKKGDSEWVSLPAKPQVDRDGQPRRDPQTGRLQYSTVVEIPDRTRREQFRAAALAAAHELLGETVA
jgi:hypothetical protein